MTQIDAIYRDGMFQPLSPVQLADRERVRLTIEPVAKESYEDWLAQTRALQAKVVARRGPLGDSTPDIAADRQR